MVKGRWVVKVGVAAPGGIVFSSTCNWFVPPLTTVRSGLPSPLKSPTATERGELPVMPIRKEVGAVKAALNSGLPSSTAHLDLWWDTGMHVAREEAQSVQATAAGLEMGATCLLVARLGALQDGGGALQVGGAVSDIKRERSDQRVGAIADLAQRDRRVFPPEAARPGGLRRDD